MIIWALATILLMVLSGYVSYHFGYFKGAEDHCSHDWERTKSGQSFYCHKCGKICWELYDL